MIRSFPKGMHPMTQLSSAILALQTDSVFAQQYAKGTNKSLYWDHTYEDVMNLIARLPEVCALIYRCTYHDGVVPTYDKNLDCTRVRSSPTAPPVALFARFVHAAGGCQSPPVYQSPSSNKHECRCHIPRWWLHRLRQLLQDARF